MCGNDIKKSQSKVHDLNIWTKITVMLIIVPGATFVAAPHFLPIPFIFIVALLFFSRIHFALFWSQCKNYAFFFLFGTIIFAMIFEHGEIIHRFGAGLLWGARFVIVIFSALLLTFTTDPIEIPIGLAHVQIPHRFGITMMVAMRMIPLIAKGITNVIHAQRARGMDWSLRPSNWSRLPKQLIAMAVPCVFITLEASVALSDTLIARGYDPYGYITLRPQAIGWFDSVIFILSGLIMLIIILLP